MKIRLITFGLTGVLLISCKNNENQKTEKTEDVVEEQSEEMDNIPVKQCYLYASEKDTISLNISKLDSNITGSLVYSLYEKDINRGEISGTMHGDTLFAEYSYMSEGKTSAREVIFLQKGNLLIEGFSSKDDNITAYTFNEDFPLKRTNCGVN